MKAALRAAFWFRGDGRGNVELLCGGFGEISRMSKIEQSFFKNMILRYQVVTFCSAVLRNRKCINTTLLPFNIREICKLQIVNIAFLFGC